MPYFEKPQSSAFADMDDTLGGRMAHARDSAGLTLENVARAMNLHAATINYWEADRAAPSHDAIEDLAQVLNVSPLWLTTGFGPGPYERAPDHGLLTAFARDTDQKIVRRPRTPRG